MKIIRSCSTVITSLSTAMAFIFYFLRYGAAFLLYDIRGLVLFDSPLFIGWRFCIWSRCIRYQTHRWCCCSRTRNVDCGCWCRSSRKLDRYIGAMDIDRGTDNLIWKRIWMHG